MQWYHLFSFLKDLQSGKAVAKDKAVTALQTALCFTGNAFATLLVERRRSILQQLNQQLAPLVDEEFENNGKLFGDDFGKWAKEGTDAIRSLSRSPSVFFDWAPPHPHSEQIQRPRGSQIRPNQSLHLIPTTNQEDQGGTRPTLSRGGHTK